MKTPIFQLPLPPRLVHALRPMMPFRRPLLPCLLAYVVGLWLVHGLGHSWPTAAGAVAAGLVVTAGFVFWKSRNAMPLILLLIAAAGSAVMLAREVRHDRAQQILSNMDPKTPRRISGVVQSSLEAQMAQRLQLEIADITVSSGTQTLRLPGRMRVHFQREMWQSTPAAPGERITFFGYVSRPKGLQNFWGYDRQEFNRHREIFSAGTPLRVRSIAVTDAASSGWRAGIHRGLMRFRGAVSGHLSASMQPEEAGLMRAMLFNDIRSLSDRQKEVFRESGTLHLFAVSGAHVAMLGFCFLIVFRSLRFGFRGSWVTVAVVLFLYLWMIDFVPSALRAYLMLLAMTLGHLIQREIDALTSLVLASAIIIGLDPAAPWEAGFVLSVVGVLGMVLFMPLFRLWFVPPGWERSGVWWKKLGLAASEITFATASASIAIFPLQLYYFGFWNALSPLANLLQALFSTAVLGAGLITGLAGFLSETVAEHCGQMTSLIMRLIYKISEATADAWWAIHGTAASPAWVVFAVGAIMAGGYFLVFRSTPEFRAKGRARFFCHGAVALVLLLGYHFRSTDFPGKLQMVVLDVGQGDSTFLKMPDGTTVLIDAGRSQPDMGRHVVVPQLRGLGVKRVDYLVATHDDDDHTGGLAEVLRQVGARHLLLPAGFEGKSRASAAMLAMARQRGCVVTELARGARLHAGGATLTVLNPAQPLSEPVDDNEGSLIFGVRYKNFSALLMGDAGLPVEARLVGEQVFQDWLADGAVPEKERAAPLTVLKLGHHGSRTASGDEFLRFVRPRYAVASCGQDNQFSHPAQEVVARLARNGTPLLRTDYHGAVEISTDGQTLAVKRAADLH